MQARISHLIAPLRMRLGARIVDQLIKALMTWYLWAEIYGGFLKGHSLVSIHWTWVLFALLVYSGYDTVSLYFFGTTIGKYLFNLYVISPQRQQLGFLQCLLRTVAGFFSLFFSWTPYVTALWRTDRAHWIDLLCETRVLSRVPQHQRVKKYFWRVIILMAFFSITGIEKAENWLGSMDWKGSYLQLSSKVSKQMEINLFFDDES